MDVRRNLWGPLAVIFKKIRAAALLARRRQCVCTTSTKTAVRRDAMVCGSASFATGRPGSERRQVASASPDGLAENDFAGLCFWVPFQVDL